MKAYSLHAVGDLCFEDVPAPIDTDDRVLLKVRAAGICGSDIPRVYENGTYHFPTVIGHEFSGESGGKRFGVFPLIPCMKCSECRKKRYEMCRNYSYLGSREDGGFAEFVSVPKDNLIELPDKVSFEQAAMLEPMAVAVHAIRQCVGKDIPESIKASEVAVCGMGTIGSLVSMFLKGMGFSSVTELRKNDIPGDDSFDIFFECVGKNEVIVEALNSVRPGGRVQLIGNPFSDMVLKKDVYWKILRKQLTLTGTWNSSFTHEEDDDWHYVLRLVSEGKVHPERLITHRFSLLNGDLKKGFELMKNKSEPYIKVMGIAD